MEKGAEALANLGKEISLLAEKNYCGWSDDLLYSTAQCLSALIHIKINLPMSKEDLARYLGVSPRTIQRRVEQNRLPKPKHIGHQKVSFMLDEVNAYLKLERDDS